jgi:CBS-domain-containing membrane protein
MEQPDSLRPIQGADRPLRRRLALRHELVLVLLPTAIVLGVLGLVEVFSQQRLLFGSLASSAFLIYLDPQHSTNTVRTLIVAHLVAACAGLGTYLLFGPGYVAGGSAMVATVVLMLLLDVIHPPAIASSLTFAFRAGAEHSVILFGMALLLIILLVTLVRSTLWLLARFARH